MVELEPEDYSNIIRWFERSYGKAKTMDDIPHSQKRTFWKLTFLCEDKIRELKDLLPPSH